MANLPDSVSLDLGPFLALVDSARDAGTFVALVLSAPHSGLPASPRQDIRPVDLGDRRVWQWTQRIGKQDHHENLSPAVSIERLCDLLGPTYRNATLRTTQSETTARVTKRGQLLVSSRRTSSELPMTQHDQMPQHLLPEGTPCPFLEAIGVMSGDGRVRASRQHKFRQINRYLEFVRDIVPFLPETGPLEVVDCGCGKSGLTFALQHYLSRSLQREVHLTGLDWNEDVLRTCRETVTRLRVPNIAFHAGDIASHRPERPVHLVVSLHACDTATDAALAQAVHWNANVILAVPCCQHELSPQLDSAMLSPLLKHGLLRERLAADVTDALRAAWLDLQGYRTQALEFIDLEHTPKNLLLRAVRRLPPHDEATRSRLLQQYQQLKQSLGITSFALDRVPE